ncbi:MAG: ribosomal protein S12 methylthiotransferase [Gammaproteobacteria bacterium]|nr:ribosomal protein S12 methylthiotransferase [Gammaproteobacteria bacterium]
MPPRKKTRAVPKVGFVSLGCPKALVDSEHIITQLRAEGYEISPSYSDADLVVINTCGFIDAAVEESLETIGEALAENGKVIVTGCLGAKDNVVLEHYPQVLAVTGPHALQEVMTAVHTHLPPRHDPFTSLIPPQGIKLTPRHYAYLKISEGCNHRCTFCIIPSLRGDLSQDTSAYGVDVKYRTGVWGGRPVKAHISDLARELGELGVWVRLHYVYPYPHVDDIIPLMAAGKILPYLDVPFQHASPRILKAMKRPAHTANTLQRIRRWREICPELVIRSTFIVGFPGETDADFESLLEFLHEAQIDHAGCFTYSAVDGAKANALENPVPETTKQDRLEQFMKTQAEISAARLARLIGTHMTVVVDALGADGQAIARSKGQAPEIDGVVYIEAATSARVGEHMIVEIVHTDEHDLIARPIPKAS